MAPRRKLVSKWLLVLGIAMIAAAANTAAQSSDDCRVAALSETQLSIACPFAGDENDTVLVYSTDGTPFTAGASWRDWVDFENELWIYDAQGDDRANLIIDFQRDLQDASLIAEIYDDQTRDGQVSYTVADDGTVTITEAERLPTVLVTALDGEWTPNGRVSYNLDINVDGLVRTIFSHGNYDENLEWEGPLPDTVVDTIVTDGIYDYTTEVRDLTNDGHADYVFSRSLLSLPSTFGVVSNELVVDTQSDDPLPTFEHLFWWHIGPNKRWEQRGETYNAPIQVDLQRSRLVCVCEFISSRANENNWFLYSISRFEPGETYRADFENPFGFYDLAGDDDGVPELQVRLQVTFVDQPYINVGQRARADTTSVRYSWNQDNDNLFAWDYKLSLLGRVTPDQIVTVGEQEFVSVAYERLPQWAVEQSWDIVSFVQDVGSTLNSTEGIYAWDISRELRDFYVQGLVADPLLRDFESVEPGYRAQIKVDYFDEPRLYFSPLDNALHLLDAADGVWQIDAETSLLYDNLDGDAYIDRWRTIATDNPDETLSDVIRYDDLQVVLEGTTLTIQRNSLPPALFETTPPTDPQTYAALDALLRQVTPPDRSPQEVSPDVVSNVLAFGGVRTVVNQVELRSVAIGENGLQLVIVPIVSAAAPIANDALGIFNTLDRPVTLTYREGEFSLAPAREAELIFTRVPSALIRDGESEVVQNRPIELQIRVDNVGDFATENLRAIAYQDDVIRVAPFINLAARESMTFGAYWAATDTEPHTLRVEVFRADEALVEGAEPVAVYEEIITAVPDTGATPAQHLSALGIVPTWFVPLMLAILGVVSLLFTSLILRNANTTLATHTDEHLSGQGTD